MRKCAKSKNTLLSFTFHMSDWLLVFTVMGVWEGLCDRLLGLS